MKKKYFLAIFICILLAACGGADLPYVITSPSSGENPDVGKLPDGSGGQAGCIINFDAEMFLETHVDPAKFPTVDPSTGILKTDKKKLPVIKLNFDGSNVSMYGDDFEPAPIDLNGNNVTLKQKPGSKATGPLDISTGEMSLSGVQFDIVGLYDKLPTFTLTTGSTGEISGGAGPLTATGKALDKQNKTMTLVGGFKIPGDFISPDFANVALAVTMEGTVDNIPDPATCKGAGGGVGFKEVTKDKDGKETEVSITQNTLSLGRVFVPESGVDTPAANDPLFVSTKTVRVRNNSPKEIELNISNPSGFQIQPSGSFKLAPDASKDFTVNFSMPAVTYTEDVPARQSEVKSTLSLGGASLSLVGLAKRAAPELNVSGGDSDAQGMIDVGSMAIRVTGTGANTKKLCQTGESPAISSRVVTLRNTGVRTLDIKKIVAPKDTDTDSIADPFCINLGTEFQRIALKVNPAGGSQCKYISEGGHSYITDECSIPKGGGEIQFKVVYMPKNASGVNDNSKDTAIMDIQNNDPLYSNKILSLNLQGGVSKDTSDLISVSKASDLNVQDYYPVKNNGVISVNIPTDVDASLKSKDQAIAILNASSDVLKIEEVSVEQQESSDFELCSVGPNLAINSDSCKSDNKQVITQVPALTGNAAGVAYFGLRFKKPDSGKKTVKSILKITYSTSAAPNVKNNFLISLTGTVGFKPFTGRVDVEIEFFGSYIYPSSNKHDPTDSIDFRNPDYANVKSGPLHLKITAPVNPNSPIYEVEILPPYDPNKVVFHDEAGKTNFLKLKPEERRRLVRLPSNNFMTCGNVVCPNDEPDNTSNSVFRNCIEPDTLEGPYQDRHCAFFYYIVSHSTPERGKFNIETGEMTIPNVQFNLYNPYHRDFGPQYTAKNRTNTVLKLTLTTQKITQAVVNGVNFVPMASSIPSLAMPGSQISQYFPKECPPKWDPTDDYINYNETPTPNIRCFMSGSSPTSDAFISGRDAEFLENGKYTIRMALITKFGPIDQGENESNDNVPFFMANGTMWVGMQGRMMQCDPGTEADLTTECKK